MKLTIVRHTRVNVPKGICYGITDVPLAETAVDDILEVTGKLKGETFDAVFSSPLTRCRILAEKICPHTEINTDERLMELDFGDWEMTSWEDIYAADEGKAWLDDFTRATCPGGGSYHEMERNVSSFLAELSAKNLENVLIVTHAGVIRIISSILDKKTPAACFAMPLEYGEICRFKLNKP